MFGIIIGEFFLNRKYRKLSEKNRALYKRLGATLNSLPIGIEIYDDSGFLITANDADKIIFGMCGRKDSLVGSLNIFKDPNLSDEIKSAVRSSKPVDTILMYDFDSVSDSGYFETSLSGKKRIVCRGAPVFFGDGEKWCYILAFLDFTEQLARSRSLENLKNSLDLAMRACGACVWYMDVKTYGFEVISGPDDILPFNNLEDFFDAIVPEARANTRSVLEEILSGKVDRKVLILSYSDSEDGELRIMEISMAGVLKYGNIVGVVGTFKELSAGIS